MVKETKTITKKVEEEIAVYKCDKCRGSNHDVAEQRDELNRILFGAEAFGTFGGNMNAVNHVNVGTTHDGPTMTGEYEYLLCDKCMEKAHDYLSDFF